MSLSATVVWEVRPSGSDTNGGGFDPGVSAPGTDFSVQDAAQIAFTDLVIGATNTQLTSASHPFGSTSPGNFINITSGTGFTTGWYEILSVSGSTATMDRAVGTASSTGGVGNLGGGFASPGQAMSQAVASNIVYVKNVGATIYTLSSTANVAGGRITISVGGSTANAPFQMIGYSTNRTLTNSDSPPTLNAGASMSGVTVQMIFINSQYVRVRNFKLRNTNSQAGGNQSTMLHMNGTAYNLAELIDIDNNNVSNWYGIYWGGNELHCYDCAVRNVNGHAGIDGAGGSTACSAKYCFVSNCTGGGYNQQGQFFRCISYSCTGTASDGFNPGSAAGVNYIDCVAYNSGRDGFKLYYDTECDNCVAYGSGQSAAGYGFNDISAGAAPICTLYNCAGGNNVSGNVNGGIPSWAQFNFVALSVDPFTSASTGDFSLNSTAGGGAALKGTGYPSSIYTTNTINFSINIGVWQGAVLIIAFFLAGSAKAQEYMIQAQNQQGYALSTSALPPVPIVQTPLPVIARQIEPPIIPPLEGNKFVGLVVVLSPMHPYFNCVTSASQVAPQTIYDPGYTRSIVGVVPTPFVPAPPAGIPPEQDFQQITQRFVEQPPDAGSAFCYSALPPVVNIQPILATVAQQEIPPFFKEDGMRVFLSANTVNTNLLSALLALLNSNNFVFLPTDLVCPIDLYGQLILTMAIDSSGGWSSINWQCCLHLEHYGILPRNLQALPIIGTGTWSTGVAIVTPPMIQQSTIIGPPPNPLPVFPDIVEGTPSTFTDLGTTEIPLDPISADQISDDPDAPPTTPITGSW